MSESNKRGAWVIGGATLVGVGIGMILLKTSVLWFVASILIGIGAGLVLAQFLRD